MGRIAIIQSFVSRVLEGIFEGGDLETVDHMSCPGDDSVPLQGDSAAVQGVQQTTGGVAVGYHDSFNAPKSAAGEKRIYARDPSSGLEVAEVWLKSDGSVLTSNGSGSFELKADGSILGSNGSGSFELKANGDFEINGAIISASGVITDGAGKVLGTHVHAITGGSSAPGPTAPPT